jgi:hypothetical protein
MRRIVLACGVLAFVGATAWGQANAPASESAKLAVFVGQWTYQGEAMATALGPAGKVAGSESLEMLGTSFLVARYQEKGPGGSSKGLAVYGYDGGTKKHYWMTFDDSGVSASGLWSVSGNDWLMTGTLQLPDKAVEQKCTVVVSRGGESVKARCEVSTDGKTWQLLSDVTYTKTK